MGGINSSTAPSPTALPSPPAVSSVSSVPTPPLRARCRSWLVAHVVPLISNKFSRVMLSLSLLIVHALVFYFAAFAFYLTHFLSADADESDESYESSPCSTFSLSLFLVFIVFRSLCASLLVLLRMRDRCMWVNQRAQMNRATKCFHLIHLSLYVLSLACVSLGYTWLASSDSSACVEPSQPMVLTLVIYETLAVLWPLAVVAALSTVFPFKSLSPFTPYIPLTSETFVQDKRGMTRRDINSLPSFIYTAGLYADDDRRCSICLGDVEVGERVKKLHCSHHFHQPCVDEWLQMRPTCPLCVQKVDAVRKQRRIRFNFSRTRRQSSPSSQAVDGTELSTTDRSRTVESSVEISDREGMQAVDALEMV